MPRTNLVPRVILFAAFATTGCTNTQAADPKEEDNFERAAEICNEVNPGVEVFDMESKETGRTHRIYVGYPLAYVENADNTYPVVYISDADSNFYPALSTMRALSAPGGDGLADAILVGVGYPTGANERALDYTPSVATDEVTKLAFPDDERATGGADKFYAFLRDTLVPHIDSIARSDGNNTLVGHSLGGLFTLYTLQQADSPFANYLMSSPSVWWEDRERLKIDPLNFESTRTAYVSVGEFEQLPPGLGELLGLPPEVIASDEAARMVEGIVETYDHLSAYENVDVFAHIEESGTHSGINYDAFSRGIRVLLPSINQGELRTRSGVRPTLPWE